MINSSEKILFHVFSRGDLGTSSAKKLRKQGKVVGNVYGLGSDSQGVYMDKTAIKKLHASHGDTGLIYLQVGDSKKQIPALISEFETDPFGNEILHVSFRRVDLRDPIKADVSVVTIGEVNIPDSVVTLVKGSVEVEALPADLPEKFEIDISTLTEVGQTITLADLTYDKSKVTLVLDEDQNPNDIPLVIVQEIKEEVEEVLEVAPEGETAEPEAQNGEKPDDVGSEN